jgi:hypothetical protein
VIAQKSRPRRVVGIAAAGLAIVAVLAIALSPSPSPAPEVPKLTFAVAPGPTPATRQGLARTMASLRQLKAPGRPLVVRLYSVFPGDTLAAASWGAYRVYLSRALGAFERGGFDVELVVRYAPLHDRSSQADVRAFSALVRRIVAAFGANRRFVSIQITNEADLTASRASDGYFNRGDAAWQALIRGVGAAKATARAHHFDQLRVGFNYAAHDKAFWRYLGQHAGTRFTDGLDWIGIDTYAGTLTPLPASGLRHGVAEAIRREVNRARRVYLSLARIPERVALHFSENGYATGNGHSYAMQVTALDSAVHTVASLSQASHVTEYDWFELRDARDSSGAPQSQLGLLTHDYRPKPAFSAYRHLIQDLG